VSTARSKVEEVDANKKSGVYAALSVFQSRKTKPGTMAME
jgi:hypothetical protein